MHLCFSWLSYLSFGTEIAGETKTLPWVPETFLARFPVSAYGRANTENSRHTREKPLVPRVLKRSRV